jgi:hypothetical protein
MDQAYATSASFGSMWPRLFTTLNVLPSERTEADAVTYEHFGRVGHEDLSTVRDGHQARGAFDLTAQVAVVAFDRFTGVETHANREVAALSSRSSSCTSTAAVGRVQTLASCPDRR